MILTGACNGVFRALDKISGEVHWTYDITKDGPQRSFHVSPVADQETIYVGSDYGDYFKFRENGVGHLYAFDLKSGNVKWKYKVNLGVGSNPVLHEKDVFFVTVDDDLISLRRDSGALNWSFKTKGLVHGLFPKSTPIVDGGRIYWGSGDGNLYVLDKKTGKVVSQRNFGKGIYTTPGVLNEYLYIATQDKVLYRFNKQKDQVQGTFNIPAMPWTQPLIDKDSLFIYSGKVLYCLDTELKNVRWKFDLGSNYGARFPLIWREAIIVASQDGSVRALHRKDGSLLWQYKIEGRIVGGIAESDGVIYIGTRQGTLFAIKI